MIHRRSFLAGLASTLIAAPAIVRAASIMPVRAGLWTDAADLILPLYGLSPAMEWMLYMDAAMADICRIMAVPECWMSLPQRISSST